MRAELFRNWAPAIAWALVILALSGEGGSSRNTEGLIFRLFPDLGPDALFYINYSLRKGAHVAGYAILGLLNFRALGWRLPGWAIGLAGVVALIDEAHQATSALRTAALADIGFDLCGAALAVMIASGARARSAE
jgi:VanZ family protein